jgi:hypothetical protein
LMLACCSAGARKRECVENRMLEKLDREDKVDPLKR